MSVDLPSYFTLSGLANIATLLLQYFTSRYVLTPKLHWAAIPESRRPPPGGVATWGVAIKYRGKAGEDVVMRNKLDAILVQLSDEVKDTRLVSTHKCGDATASHQGHDVQIQYRHLKPGARMVVEIELEKPAATQAFDDTVSMSSSTRTVQHHRLSARTFIIPLVFWIVVGPLLFIFLEGEFTKWPGELLGRDMGDMLALLIALVVPVVVTVICIVHSRLFHVLPLQRAWRPSRG